MDILKKGGRTRWDAVVAAVTIVEDDPNDDLGWLRWAPQRRGRRWSWDASVMPRGRRTERGSVARRAAGSRMFSRAGKDGDGKRTNHVMNS